MLFAHENIPVRFHSAYEIKREKGTQKTISKKSYHAMSIRLSGEARFMFEGKELTVGSGEVLLIPPNLDYCQHTEGETILAIHFAALECRETELIEKQKVENWPEIRELFRSIWRCYVEKPEGWYYEASGMLYRLIGILHAGSSEKDARSDDALEKAYGYLEEHYADHGLSVKQLADLSGYSEAYFRRQFSDRFGCTPSDRIAELRLERAKRLLESGTMTMGEITEQIGIAEPKYFSTWFRKLTGMSPRDYVWTLRG